jgi:dienelactone hydrolase
MAMLLNHRRWERIMSRTGLAFALILIASSAGAVLAQESALNRDGTLLEEATGFPFDTYDQWFQDRSARYSFDETGFRKKYPPEDFASYKDEIHCPFDTYEEWIRTLRKRFGRSRFTEAAFRAKYPPEHFGRYRQEIDYTKIKYLSDGLSVGGYIVKPKNSHGKRLPVIIYNRGGNRDIGLVDFETLYGLFDLVSRGYVVAASQYRGCSESEGRDEFGGSDVNDVLNLVALIESLPYVDPSRIGMFGWSRGGMMTYIVLSRTDSIGAAVIGAGPTDLLNRAHRGASAENMLSALIPGYEQNRERELKSRSAIYWPERLSKKTPVLLLQGSADWRNDPADVLRMACGLYESKHPFRLVFFEGGDHGLNEYEGEVRDLVLAWFDRYVRDLESWPSLEPHGD